MVNINKKSILKLDYVSFDGNRPRNEFEIKEKIISEFQKLKSEKLGHINTINIDYAIDIIKRI